MLIISIPNSASGSDPVEDENLFPWQDGSAVLVGAYMGGFRSISEGVASAKDGQSVYIAPGLYRENVLVNKSVRLVGLFDRYIGIDGSRGNFSIRVTADGASLEDIVVLNASNGIEVISCNDVNITGCKAFYCNIGLSLANCTETFVSGCTFMMNRGAGMYLTDTMDILVNGTESSDNGYGFGMYYARYTTFKNCTATGNSKAGFHLYWLSFGTRIVDSYSGYNDIGIHILDVNDVHVLRCDLSDNAQYGVHIMSQDSTVEGCYISSSDNDGVLVESSERVRISNNTVYSCKRGIVLRSTNNITLSYNLLRSNPMGIKLVLGSSGNIITQNDIITGYSGSVAASSCGTNLWSYNYWPDSDLKDDNGDGLFDGEYEIEGDPPARDIYPRAFPLTSYRAVSRIFWKGEPTVNGTIALDGSNSWPPGDIRRYNWTVEGCGIRSWGEGPEIKVCPTYPGNLSVQLRIWSPSSLDDYSLVIPIDEERTPGKEVGLDTPRVVFIVLVITGSATVLVSLNMYRRFRRPLPPVPHWSRWPGAPP